MPADGPTRQREYERLTAAGVNPRTAATLAWHIARVERRREVQRASNCRSKPCPQCERRVQSGNLARHRRTHAREYGRWAG